MNSDIQKYFTLHSRFIQVAVATSKGLTQFRGNNTWLTMYIIYKEAHHRACGLLPGMSSAFGAIANCNTGWINNGMQRSSSS